MESDCKLHSNVLFDWLLDPVILGSPGHRSMRCINLTALVVAIIAVSFAAIFAQLGGGIYTKGADIGADIVGKLEIGLNEDDYRNPGTIADNVGDNVGDCAGRGADLFESSSANNLGAMIIGATLSSVTGNPLFIIFSLITRALGNLAAIIGGYFLNIKDEVFTPIKAFTRSLTATSILASAFFFVISWVSFGTGWYILFFCSLIGIILGIISYFIVNYYTSSKYRPVKEIIRGSETGAATNVISGFALGLESTLLPIISFIVGILVCFYLGEIYGDLNGIDSFTSGVFGVTVATMGLLSITTLILAFDGFGPVADNAAGIAEMAHLGPEVRQNLDHLDALGNTTKALAKGFGMTCAALSAIVLYVAYLEETHISIVNIYNPVIICTLFIGGVAPFLFSSLAIRATGISAHAMIKEIQKQISEILDSPVILLGKGGGGSRLLSLLASDCGVFLGNDVNISGDCMDMVIAIYQSVIEKYKCKAEWQKKIIVPQIKLAAAKMLEEFLKRHLDLRPGEIIDKEGKILGKHKGLALYTIGQRKGIGLSGGPYYVLAKDTKNNLLIVTKNEKDLYKKELIAKDVNWISGKPPQFPIKVKAKIRYLHKPASATVYEIESQGKIKVVFDKPQRAITPGQSAVFYKREEVLGGGIIEKS